MVVAVIMVGVNHGIQAFYGYKNLKGQYKEVYNEGIQIGYQSALLDGVRVMKRDSLPYGSILKLKDNYKRLLEK